MSKINYAVKNLWEELKKGALSFNNCTNITSLTDDTSVVSGSTAPTDTSNTTTTAASNAFA
jgi:hypothetical protein